MSAAVSGAHAPAPLVAPGPPGSRSRRASAARLGALATDAQACFNAQPMAVPELLARRCSSRPARPGTRTSPRASGARRPRRSPRSPRTRWARRSRAWPRRAPRVRRCWRSSATSTRSGSRSRTSRTAGCSRSPRSAGSRPRCCSGQRFELLTQNGRVPGVIGRRRPKAEERATACGSSSPTCISTSARRIEPTPRRSCASAMPRCGPGARSSCRTAASSPASLDNRLGAFVALEAARRVAGGRRGASSTSSRSPRCRRRSGCTARARPATALEPHVAIAVDVTYATDYPGGNASLAGRVDLGGGAMIARGPTLNRQVVDGLGRSRRAQNGIAHALRGLHPRHAYRRRRAASRPARESRPRLLSIPLRYMHSPTELCDLADVESAVQLIAAYALSLARDESFVR